MTTEPQKPSSLDEQKVIEEQAAPEARSEKEERRAAAEFSKAGEHGKSDMRVKVYSPFRNYYEGQALSVSAVNATGPFDILPRHHNFISLLSAGDLVVRRNKDDERKIIISGGIVHVKADEVIVFLDV